MKSQTFGEKLKERRESMNYSLEFVGERIDYDPRLLSKIEKNELKTPENIIKELSIVYEVPYKELIVKYLSENIYYEIRNSAYADEILNEIKRRLKKEGKGTQIIKSRDEIFELIKTYFKYKPVERAYVFGSFARNTSISMDSDIDILVVFKKPNKITLFDLIEMREELSERTGREIDLVEEGQELQSFKNAIEKEKFLIYGS